jgi:hypothetical protein
MSALSASVAHVARLLDKVGDDIARRTQEQLDLAIGAASARMAELVADQAALIADLAARLKALEARVAQAGPMHFDVNTFDGRPMPTAESEES